MRNKPIVLASALRQTLLIALGLAAGAWLGGCTDATARQTLNRGYASLDTRDYDAANNSADEFLRTHPSGSGVAEAHYLKGRVEEERAQDPQVSHTLDDKRAHLDAARDEYERGLDSLAPFGVKAQLHTGIANVDFYEEDYAGALREWQTSYDNLQSEDAKAWVLYHIGRCQQRLGQFNKADETFTKVERLYPASEAATRAASRIGATGFYVEVGSFPNVKNAEAAAGELRAGGYAASRTVDAGRDIVRVGPIPTYIEAKAVQGRLRAQYPGAIIWP